jgi:hypothetical protein
MYTTNNWIIGENKQTNKQTTSHSFGSFSFFYSAKQDAMEQPHQPHSNSNAHGIIITIHNHKKPPHAAL